MRFLSLCLLCIMLFLHGCGSEIERSNVIGEKAYTVTDARGRQLDFKEKPCRIVSTYVYGDEILLDLVEHERIIGLSKWVHDPDLALGCKKAEDVPGIVENNTESILKLKPDLILLPDNVKEDYLASLEEVGQKIYVYKAASRVQQIPGVVRSIGQAVGEREQAELVVKQMEHSLMKTKEKVAKLSPEKKQSALLFLRFGAIGGEGSIFHDTMALAGIEDCYQRGRNLSENQGGMSGVLSKEEVVKANPSLILFSSWSQEGAYKDSRQQIEEMCNDPAFADVEAIRDRNIVVIPQGYVNCLSQNVSLAVEGLYKAVYESNLHN